MAEAVSPRPRLPDVTVLLATHNGLLYLPEQLDSIFAQLGVTVRVVASDDESTDGTWEYLSERAESEPRLEVLSRHRPAGPAANFYRLLTEVTADGPVAFADQDDIWHPDKLSSQVAELDHGAAGVSSDVMAFGPQGRWLIRKSYPQRRFDFLCESPGPGCSQVLGPDLAAQIREVLVGYPAAEAMDSHDWLFYGVCRSAGRRWVIQDRPTLDYRQHAGNAVGANHGLRAMWYRVRLIKNDWHRSEALKMAEVGLRVAAPSSTSAVELGVLRDLLADKGFRSRMRLVSRAGQLRRRPRDRFLLAAMIAVGLW